VDDELSGAAPSLCPCVLQIIDGFRFDPGPLVSVSYTFPFVFEPQH